MPMLNDLRYALRTLRANRLFAAMAMLSLALGIGANTAIYSFMDAILVRSLPVRNPESLAGQPRSRHASRQASMFSSASDIRLLRCRTGFASARSLREARSTRRARRRDS